MRMKIRAGRDPRSGDAASAVACATSLSRSA
jgi:hypothetical protein